MKLRHPIALLVFAAVAVAHLFAKTTGAAALDFWTKPLLMPALALWFWLETRPSPSFFSKNWVVAGLLLSWLGDCFLLFQHEKTGPPWFLLGLGAFLAAHVCYLVSFLKMPAAAPSFLGKNRWLLLPFALFLVGMDCFLWPSLPGGLRGPVVFYSLAITAMAVGAASLFGKIDGRAARLVFIGALFFICSDSLLAVNTFRAPFAGAGFFIMLTYLLGQFGIVFGMVSSLKPTATAAQIPSQNR